MCGTISEDHINNTIKSVYAENEWKNVLRHQGNIWNTTWLMFSVVSLFTPLSFSLCRQYNVDYKLDTYLKIARLYLEDDDPVQAEAYINRASLLQNESTNEQLQIHYKVHNLFMIFSFLILVCHPNFSLLRNSKNNNILKSANKMALRMCLLRDLTYFRMKSGGTWFEH